MDYRTYLWTTVKMQIKGHLDFYSALHMTLHKLIPKGRALVLCQAFLETLRQPDYDAIMKNINAIAISLTNGNFNAIALSNNGRKT